MQIIAFDTLQSTQTFLIDSLKNASLKAPICVMCEYQTNGVGSRGNAWNGVENGLYFSFCIHKDSLSSDVKIQSQSIFFGFLFKEQLRLHGSKVWLKWPNDLYLERQKVGGVICNLVGENIICGIGVNIQSSEFAHIESGVIANKRDFVDTFLTSISQYTWEMVFKRYKKEFYKNYDWTFHHKNRILSLKNALLCESGAIKIDDEIIYSLR